MPDQTEHMLPDIISKALALPVVRVDRRTFLTKLFPHATEVELMSILKDGPQADYTLEQLTKVARRVVMHDTEKTSAISFAAGLPSNIAVAAGTGTADLIQYYGFALRMAQKVAYIYGQENLFTEEGTLSEDGERDVMIYLGVMLGVASANSALMFISKGLSNTLSKKFMATAVTRTTWYPLLKKIAGYIGVSVTKKSTSAVISKSLPVIGGFVSGGLTLITFRPMGNRLIKTFETTLTATPDQIKQAQNVILEDIKKSSNE
ncbi:hypothetical protein [Lacticaseibacillus sharpeae]|jgi:hypothetical protein|uniref:ABC transporter ATPase n=1 Tax=Lacticaseibacillus sharpeae JCM 1186 = DSM 20505 TaxID=1291052 RepID=A0A0R1ZKS7_9LACO|nr:hypothetical protein [Lacticaseibacillus sharpeae]KRM55119.1 hypothetical protein FC18_GL001566 [Lacticaseibacillus sharpeae JCM 1186 = DSM 20505]